MPKYSFPPCGTCLNRAGVPGNVLAQLITQVALPCASFHLSMTLQQEQLQLDCGRVVDHDSTHGTWHSGTHTTLSYRNLQR